MGQYLAKMGSGSFFQRFTDAAMPPLPFFDAWRVLLRNFVLRFEPAKMVSEEGPMFVEARQSTEERAMKKTYPICIVAVAMLAGAISAQAHEFDSGEKVVMNCRAGSTPYMDDVVYAVEHSHYWATSGARRKMLTLARQACASGSKRIAFAPPPDQR